MFHNQFIIKARRKEMKGKNLRVIKIDLTHMEKAMSIF